MQNVKRGELHIYRVFEAAHDVDFDELVRIGKEQKIPVSKSSISIFSDENRIAYDVDYEPISIALPLPSGGDLTLTGQVQASVFHFGVISVCFSIPFDRETTPDELATWVRALGKNETIDQHAIQLSERIHLDFGRTFKRPAIWKQFETYHVLQILEWASTQNQNELATDADVARILAGESANWKPSRQSIEQATSTHYSYGEKDICFIDWDVSLVVDPDERTEYPDIIELAVTHLIEFRYYDQIFEKETAKIYSQLTDPDRLWAKIRSPRPHNRVARLNRLNLEIAEFIDRADNTLKVMDDTFYARVFRGALNKFHVQNWLKSVTRKHEIVSQSAQTLYGEAQDSRSTVLEVIIVALIALEIILATFVHR